MINRNKLIGETIGKTAGYAVQCFAYSKLATLVGPQVAIGVRFSAKYGGKALKYIANENKRTDFQSETIFSDAMDATFDAY